MTLQFYYKLVSYCARSAALLSEKIITMPADDRHTCIRGIFYLTVVSTWSLDFSHNLTSKNYNRRQHASPKFMLNSLRPLLNQDLLITNLTAFSKHVGCLKEAGLKFKITQKILKQTSPHNPVSNRCNLCLWEKYFIICRPELATLKKRNELVTSCRHTWNRGKPRDLQAVLRYTNIVASP